MPSAWWPASIRRARTIRLITNTPKKIQGLETYGVTVAERVPIEVPPHPGNIRYLLTKQEKLGSPVVGHATKLKMLGSACWSYVRFAVARRVLQPAG